MTTITFQESLNLETKSFNSVSDFLWKIDFEILREKYKERKIKQNAIKKSKFIEENYEQIIVDLKESENEKTIDFDIARKMLSNNLKEYAKI